jgi:hypothetical protein
VEFVAAKKLECCHLDLVHHEVQLLSHFAHPHILGFVNWYQTTRHIWIVLELCPGGDLRALLAADSALFTAVSLPSFNLFLFFALLFFWREAGDIALEPESLPTAPAPPLPPSPTASPTAPALTAVAAALAAAATLE